MERSFFILFILCSVAVPLSLEYSYTTTRPSASAIVTQKTESVQLVATPDYPVAAGQTVNLHCNSSLDYVNFTWEHRKYHIWQTVSNGSDLTLTKPEESGFYRCRSIRMSVTSSEHMVFIISVHKTGEGLTLAAFVLSILALMIALAVLLWLVSERLCKTSEPEVKGFPDMEKSPKGGLPNCDNEGEVYMNYTGTNPAYTDLDPTRMTADNLYASLS